jgi:hypothetical protein
MLDAGFSAQNLPFCYGSVMSLFADAAPRVRPPGIRALGLGCLALAAYVAVNGLLVLLGAVSFASGTYILGDLVTMGPVIYFVVAALSSGLGFSLLRGFRWSRRAGIIAAALLVAGAVMPVSSAVIYSQIVGIVIHGAKIVLAIVIIRYLMQPEVADWFSARTDSQST